MSITIQFTAISNTSDSYDFELTRNQIIEKAYLIIGVKGSNQNLTAEQYTQGSDLLNAMIKNWAADNSYLWTQEWIDIPLVNSDVVSNNGIDYICIINHNSTASNEPGVGESWKRYWTTLTSTTGDPWALSSKYVSNSNYSLGTNVIGIDVARVKQNQNYSPIMPMSKNEYFALGDPFTTGRPTRYYFRKQEVPEIFLYPAPDNVDRYTIEASVYRYPQDFDIGADDPDFLQEWIEPMIFGLAARLAPGHGIFGQQLKDIREQAADSLDVARGADHEFGDFFIKPDLYSY